ncbi:hypothetical protein [Litoribacillus peritrichatus]|uniref:Uncharacterized protein n=1 Tax=Litoribacillus peritrichatus TaxID=718191 RepID=A0ABP7M9R1_9GAMM
MNVLKCLMLVVFIPALAHSKTIIDDSLSTATAFVINGTHYSDRLVEGLYQSQKAANNSLSKEAIAIKLIQNQLITEDAIARFTEQQLWNTNVGFSKTSRLAIHTTSLLNRLVGNDYRANAPTAESVIASHLNEQWSAIETLFKPARGLAEITLSPEKTEKLSQIKLATYHYPKANSATLDLKTLYTSQNLQGKMAFHQRNIKHVATLINRHAHQYMIQAWVKHTQKLTQQELSTIQSVAKNQLVSDKSMTLQGLTEHMHDDNTALKEAAKSISQQAILSYYFNNKDQFKITESASGWAIQCENQALCEQARESRANGNSYQSILNDITGVKPAKASASSPNNAQITKLTRSEAKNMWLANVMLVSKENTLGKPIRAPQLKNTEPGWYLVEVTSKETGFIPANNEAVRYQASRNIAKQQLIQQWQHTSKLLHEQAVILLSKPYSALRSALIRAIEQPHNHQLCQSFNSWTGNSAQNRL